MTRANLKKNPHQKKTTPSRIKKKTDENGVVRDRKGRLAKGTTKQPGSGRQRIVSLVHRNAVEQYCEEEGYNPLETLVKVAKGEKVPSGQFPSPNVQMLAAKTILENVRPPLRPVADPDDPDEKRASEKHIIEMELERERLRAVKRANDIAEERGKGDGSSLLEGRPFPVDEPGRGPCGLYHAALDPAVYPKGFFVLRPPAQTDPCPICGRDPISAEDTDPGPLPEAVDALPGAAGESP